MSIKGLNVISNIDKVSIKYLGLLALNSILLNLASNLSKKILKVIFIYFLKSLLIL